MLFSGISFLFGFLPLTLALYYAVPIHARNAVLLTASLFFYFWGEPVYLLLMLAAIGSGFVHGLLIERLRGGRWARAALLSSLVLSIGALALFKYADFFVGSLNAVFGTNTPLLRLPLPLGISFYTFQLMSYTIDVYRGTPAQRDLVAFGTYIAMFPQLVAGPIVRYGEIAGQLVSREYDTERFSRGVRRFIFGLSKKVIIANTLAELTLLPDGGSALSAWLFALGYTLQIYFDFSGYSDMAIGLGGMLGFTFPENFRHPYCSASISEFWRRWHITLGAWFRDYVYFPLGGSRVGKGRLALNLLVVWLLTGLWHGAAWSFVVWGLYFGLLIMSEKLLLGKRIERIPRAVRLPITLLLVIIGFVIFGSDTLAQAGGRLYAMLPTAGQSAAAVELFRLRDYAPVLLLGAVGATPLPALAVERLRKNSGGARVINTLEPVVLLLLLAVCTAYLVDGSFNPFLYFRF